MSWLRLSLTVMVLGLGSVSGLCDMNSMEVDFGSSTTMSFVGFNPSVQRFTSTDSGTKIVFKNYARMPIVEEKEGGVLSVSAGDLCETVPSEGTKEPASSTTSFTTALALALPVLVGRNSGLSGYTVAGLSLATWGAFSSPSFAQAQALDGDGSDAVDACDVVPIDVEIYVAAISASSDELVMREYNSGDFEICPPETLYWKHHPKVFDGYEGCVGEKGFYPCAQDAQGIRDEGGDLAMKYPVIWDGSSCVDTGYTTENRTFWILWGDPLDKHELNKRTGLNPVVSFPFNRGPYPSYDQGVPIEDAIDDSSDARAMAKDLLVYIGAFSEAELNDYEITMTEGAEVGMTAIWAAKALEIARTTCNRDIYALMEVPAYGYSPSDAAAMVNREASSFYNGTECMCANTTTCFDPIVTISNAGWIPRNDLPQRMGGDGNMYSADSASPASPWMESMVFPENPTGTLKTPRLPNSNRRLCDGVYLWPMYFGMRDNVIPMSERPDCAAWSFSITKAYSATVRAGFIMYKKTTDSNVAANQDIQGQLYSMTHGLYSEWSWFGQMQLWEMIMSREVSDPTSWIGAYTEIMNEKWDLIIDAFADCPVISVTNPRAGAYAFFKLQPEYTGIQNGGISSFFRDVMGIRATTYSFGFRGVPDADVARFYGEGYGKYDFVRLQLYRDITVYEETARRAKIVCNDQDAVIGDFASVNQWVSAAATAPGRHLVEYKNKEERRRHLVEAAPSLSQRQLDYMVKSHEDTDEMNRNLANCAPDFTMTCLFKKLGTRFNDF